MNSKKSAYQAVLFQYAQSMCYQGQLERGRDAAAIAEVALSTCKHRMSGRRSAEDYDKTRRLLNGGRGIAFGVEMVTLWKN